MWVGEWGCGGVLWGGWGCGSCGSVLWGGWGCGGLGVGGNRDIVGVGGLWRVRYVGFVVLTPSLLPRA